MKLEVAAGTLHFAFLGEGGVHALLPMQGTKSKSNFPLSKRSEHVHCQSVASRPAFLDRYLPCVSHSRIGVHVAGIAILESGSISLVYKEQLDISMSRLDSCGIQVYCYPSISIYIRIRRDYFLGGVRDVLQIRHFPSGPTQFFGVAEVGTGISWGRHPHRISDYR
jgi:hypothetical protein